MIKNEIKTFKNLKGKTIVGFYDFNTACSNKLSPTIIIPPAYGESKSDSIALSYFLVENGFDVFRYDGTNHVGESEGEIFHFSMNNCEIDLVSALNFVQNRLGVSGVGIVAKSLVWRVALRVSTRDRRIKFLLGIGGIVNLQNTLKAVYRKDIVGDVLKDKYKDWKFADILGFEVSTNFIDSAIKENYHNINGTKKDLIKSKIPMVYMYAEKDAWVRLSDVNNLLKTKNGKFRTEFCIIPQALHQISENPDAVMFTFKKIVASCVRYLGQGNGHLEDVSKPDVKLVARQNRFEKSRLKIYELNKKEEKKFWEEYLTKYFPIIKSPYYREYLALMDNLFGDSNSNEIVLDAGCGPSRFGFWMASERRINTPIYIGIDFIHSVLRRAKKEYYKGISTKKNVSIVRKPQMWHICGDLESPRNNSNNSSGTESYLCFKDNTFDKICCSLLISYIESPLFLMREFSRTIKPGGKIVVSSLKPNADFSLIYRDFADQAKNKKEIEDARNLLSGAGRIKQKESQGHYQFYSDNDLVKLLKKVKFSDIKCYRAFGNQVNMAIAIKK